MIFHATVFDQKRTLDELIEESKASQEFYLFLFSSAVITALGLLADNTVVVIGGMLVAPILFPILFLSMAITTASSKSIKRALRTLGKSILVVFIVSLVVGFLFGGGEITDEILLRSQADLTSFLIAFFAGFVGAFGWIKHKIATMVAGIAVSVSLIPPLASFGLGIALLSKTVIAGALTLFLINLAGVVLAGLVTFVLFGFGKLQKEEEEKIHEEKMEEHIQKKALEEQKIVDKKREKGLEE